MYLLAPILGPVVGPLAGAWITRASHWRWIFWGSTILGAAVQAVGVLLLDESECRDDASRSGVCADALQHSRPFYLSVRLRGYEGNTNAQQKRRRILYSRPLTREPATGTASSITCNVRLTGRACSWEDLLQIRLIRPFVFFVTEPTIQLFGLYLAFSYGTMYRESHKTSTFAKRPTEFRP